MGTIYETLVDSLWATSIFLTQPGRNAPLYAQKRSRIGGEGEKKSAWARKEIGERSEPRGSLGRVKGGGTSVTLSPSTGHLSARLARRYFYYLTSSLPFFPSCGAWSQASWARRMRVVGKKMCSSPSHPGFKTLVSSSRVCRIKKVHFAHSLNEIRESEGLWRV